jgi:heat shock protein HtpX
MERKWYGGDAGLSARMFLTMFLLFAVYAVFLYFMFEAGADFATMTAIAVVYLLIQYFFSDQLVLLTTGARVVTPDQAPELHARIDRLCQLADLPKPKVAVMQSQMPNAFATGRGPSSATVAVTTELMSRLDGPELDAVIAHELSHIKNRDVAVMTIASFLSTVAFTVVRFSMWFGFAGGDRRDRRSDGGAIIIGYLGALAVWLISMLLIRALSRYREFAADRGSAIITGSPSQLASALVKISGAIQRIPERDLREVQGANAFFILPAISRGSLLELFSTHPSLEHRLERLRRMEQQIEGL